MTPSEETSVLGYSNSRDTICKHVEDDDVAKRDIIDSKGRKQFYSFINESGLYSLILSSKLPQAKEFKRWVTSEVLPQIRMTDGYIPVSKDDDVNTIQRKAIVIMNRTIEQMRTKAVLALADEIIDKELSVINKDAEDTLTATDYNLTFI